MFFRKTVKNVLMERSVMNVRMDIILMKGNVWNALKNVKLVWMVSIVFLVMKIYTNFKLLRLILIVFRLVLKIMKFLEENVLRNKMILCWLKENRVKKIKLLILKFWKFLCLFSALLYFLYWYDNINFI